ncbi:MAG: alpha/beta hydrolase [Solirubrobacteraceae bacterium]
MIRSLLNSLLYFPSREFIQTPEQAGLVYRDLAPQTDPSLDDGERLHGWWIAARTGTLGHLLLCHGNAGNVADRLVHAAPLTAAGFDVLLFDYRGYGRSSGTPSEAGTYRDARGAEVPAGPARRRLRALVLPGRVAWRCGRFGPRARLPARGPRLGFGIHRGPRARPAALSRSFHWLGA